MPVLTTVGEMRLLHWGDHEEAAAAHAEARRLNPQLALSDRALRPQPGEAHDNEENVLQDLRRPVEVVVVPGEVLRLLHQLFLQEGNMLYELGRHEEALAAYEEAIRLNPGMPRLTTIRELCSRALGAMKRQWQPIMRQFVSIQRMPRLTSIREWCFLTSGAMRRQW